jgi:hypothetical protein
MVTLDHAPGERLPTYLARAFVLSRQSNVPICCVFDGRVFVVRPEMNVDEAHQAWLDAQAQAELEESR